MQFAIVFDNKITGFREFEAQPECKVIDGIPVVRPMVEIEPDVDHKKGGFIIFDDRVEREILPKDKADKDKEKEKEAKEIEQTAGRLFFVLCDVLLKNNVVDLNDPDFAEVKTAYQRRKTLTGN